MKREINTHKIAGGRPIVPLVDEAGQWQQFDKDGVPVRYVAGFDDYKEGLETPIPSFFVVEESPEFIALQRELLRHKKLYYVDNNPEISDYDYDMLEKKSYQMAQALGFRADKWEDPEDNEKHHVHWMVGYDEKSVYNNQ